MWKYLLKAFDIWEFPMLPQLPRYRCSVICDSSWNHPLSAMLSLVRFSSLSNACNLSHKREAFGGISLRFDIILFIGKPKWQSICYSRCFYVFSIGKSQSSSILNKIRGIAVRLLSKSSVLILLSCLSHVFVCVFSRSNTMRGGKSLRAMFIHSEERCGKLPLPPHVSGRRADVEQCNYFFIIFSESMSIYFPSNGDLFIQATCLNGEVIISREPWSLFCVMRGIITSFELNNPQCHVICV